MNIYVNTDFEGHWPVGTAAIVIARDADHAAELLRAELPKHGLKGDDVTPEQFRRVPTTQALAVVLRDGDY